MEASGVLSAMQAEFNCPICLTSMREPATIECGHNFCYSCIQQCWEGPQDNFSCPVCRHLCQKRHWTANRKLAKIVDFIQLMDIGSKEVSPQEENLCERHSQVLSLFCEEDLEVLCPDCVEPHDQQRHHVRSLEEAASYYRHKTNDSITLLREDLQKLQKVEEREDRKFQELRDQILKHKSKLDSGIENLKEFVDRQQEAALSRLAQEEKDLLQRIKINITDFKDHICTTKAQLQEVSERCVMSDMKLLSEVKRIHHIYESREVPAVCFSQLRREVYHLPPLESALEKIQQKFRAEVTLDPHTADPHLCVSKDKRSVTLRKRKSKVLQGQQRIPFDLEVLGSQEFHAGRHYWEVQVNDKPSWAIGLCSHSPSSRGQQQPRSGQNRRWTIHLQDGFYVAGGARPVVLTLKRKPRGIGVYLDWELGQISFYNLRDNSHLHSFKETFSYSLKPYFCVGPDSIPLSLCGLADL